MTDPRRKSRRYYFASLIDVDEDRNFTQQRGENKKLTGEPVTLTERASIAS